MVRTFGVGGQQAQVVSLGLRPLATPTPTTTTSANPYSELFEGDESSDEDEDEGDDDGSLFGDSEHARSPKAGKKAKGGTTTTAMSGDVLMTAYIDGQVLLWDRRAGGGKPSVRLEMGEKSPPWCVSVS